MEISKTSTILVPTDFTSVADCAVQNATEIAQVNKQNICLLHVVSKHASKQEKESIKTQLINISEKFSKRTGISISYHISEGSIFNAITNMVEDVSAELIVMGVHGTNKYEDILGSFAYKVICSSKVPVMIVKECFDKLKDHTIVLPVDFSHDNTHSTNLAIKYAKQFDCVVNVTGVLFSKSSLYDTIISKEKKENQINKIADTIKSTGITVKSDIMIKPKTILVPTDFTPVATKALEHAIEIAKTFERKICLLHVVGKNTKDKELKKVEQQLKNITDENKKRYGIELTFLIKYGSIFDVITDTVSEISAGLMVIGFQGKQGVEHVTGGFAYTVIRNSTVPVMVVKKNHRDISDNHIVVPVNYPHENIKKVDKSIKFAKTFGARIHIVAVLHTKEAVSQKIKDEILEKITIHMAKKGVKYITEILIRSKAILVPIDFTPKTYFAINYALEIAKQSDQNVFFLHVHNGSSKVIAKNEIEGKLKEMCQTNSKLSGVNVSYITEKGSIFDVIGKVAEDISAELIIMGIHDKKGFQHIVGSNAFKVIKSSKVPVMVVKQDYPKRGIKNIVIPISVEHESTQKVFKAIDFANYFESSVHVAGFLHSEGSVYKIEKEALVKNVASHIENAGIKVNTEILKISKSSAESTFIKYSQAKEADLIIIVAKKSSKMSEIIGQNFAEQIVVKSNTPILNIIPYAEFDEDETYAVGSFVDPLGLMRKE